MALKDTLEQFGLNEKEAKLYLAALELGVAPASFIAKKANMQRTNFYDLSEKLLEQGLLIRTVKGKKHYFSAVDPTVLLEVEEAKLKKLKDTLPEFQALFNTVGQKPRVFYFEGKSGIDQLNEDALNYDGEMVGFTTPQFVLAQSKSTGSKFISKRVAKGNHSRVIGEDSLEVRDLQKKDKEELRETRILSPDVFNSNIEIVIYADKMMIADYKQEFGFIIEGSEIARVMKMIFEIIWSKWDA